MKRRGRVRRVAKWAALVVCLLIAAAWAMTYWWALSYSWHPSGEETVAGLAMGGLVVVRTGRSPPLPTGWALERGRGLWSWLPWWREGPGPRGLPLWFVLPLWMPLLVAALPTAWLWWRDRRRPRPGHCRCGYDLAGLAPGAACPECGKAAAVTVRGEHSAGVATESG